jgi:hypothetical protein
MARLFTRRVSKLLSGPGRRWSRSTIATGAAAVLVLALGGLAAAPEAHAASGEPLCLYYSPTFCLQSHGLYNQVTISDTSYSYWTATYLGSDEVMYQNDSGLCLREDNALNGFVVVGAACSASDENDVWVLATTTGPERYWNLAGGDTNGFLLVASPANGLDVYAAAPENGWWWGWLYE